MQKVVLPICSIKYIRSNFVRNKSQYKENKRPTGLNSRLSTIAHTETLCEFSYMHLIKLHSGVKENRKYGNDHNLPT